MLTWLILNLPMYLLYVITIKVIMQGKPLRHSFHCTSDAICWWSSCMEKPCGRLLRSRWMMMSDVNMTHSQPANVSTTCNIHESNVVQNKPLHSFHHTSDMNTTHPQSTSASLNTHVNKSERGSPFKSFNHANDFAIYHVQTAPATVNSICHVMLHRIPF